MIEGATLSVSTRSIETCQPNEYVPMAWISPSTRDVTPPIFLSWKVAGNSERWPGLFESVRSAGVRLTLLLRFDLANSN